MSPCSLNETSTNFLRKCSVKMILFCIILFLLHQGYTLVPVSTVQLGEPVIITCTWLVNEFDVGDNLHWYKQSFGDKLKIIVKFSRFATPNYGPEFSASRMHLNVSGSVSNLTILRTIQEDAGMYHCAVRSWTKNTWSATLLLIKGNAQRTSNYTVIERPTVTDPARPGAPMTLQCSVLSESKTCPGDHTVFWFKPGSDKSHPHIIYTDGHRQDECNSRSDTQKSCVYHFSISSTDVGTYYCAVATCGEILFGDGTKLQGLGLEQSTGAEFIVLVVAIVCLVISLIGNLVFICWRTSRSTVLGRESSFSPEGHDDLGQQVHEITEGGDDLHYAALHSSGGKGTRGRKKKELKTEESVYSYVKC